MITMETCKSKNPKISIVIPTLNEAKHIGNLLSSLKPQSFKDFETIIVDGGVQVKLSRRWKSLIGMEK